LKGRYQFGSEASDEADGDTSNEEYRMELLFGKAPKIAMEFSALCAKCALINTKNWERNAEKESGSSELALCAQSVGERSRMTERWE